MIVRQMRDDVFQGLSNAELLLLLDTTNATVFTAGDKVSAGCFVLGSAEDAMKLDKLDGKWGVNAEAFLAKLRNLTDLQAFELVVRLDCAWRNHERVEDHAQWVATAFERPAAPAADVLVREQDN